MAAESVGTSAGGAVNGVVGSTALVAGLGTLAAGALMVALTMGTMSDIKAGAQTRMDAALAAKAAELVESGDVSDEGSSSHTRKGITAVDGADSDDGESTGSDSDSGSSKSGNASKDSGKSSDKQASGVDDTTSVGVSQAADLHLDRNSLDGTFIDANGNLYRRVGSIWDIQWGDTLSYISRQTGVSVDAIARENGIQDVDLIYADSSISIP